MSFSGFGIQYSSRCDEKILLVACSRNSGDFGMEVVEGRIILVVERMDLDVLCYWTKVLVIEVK